MPLRSSLMGTDREYLVVSADGAIGPDSPVRLVDLPPLELVLPDRENVRRRKIDQYLATNGIETGRFMELDSMFTTLDLVARSDWATILPGILCQPDFVGKRRRVIPITDPELTVDYLRIEPMSVPLSDAGQAFYSFLMDELVTALEGLAHQFQQDAVSCPAPSIPLP